MGFCFFLLNRSNCNNIWRSKQVTVRPILEWNVNQRIKVSDLQLFLAARVLWKPLHVTVDPFSACLYNTHYLQIIIVCSRSLGSFYASDQYLRSCLRDIQKQGTDFVSYVIYWGPKLKTYLLDWMKCYRAVRNFEIYPNLLDLFAPSVQHCSGSWQVSFQACLYWLCSVIKMWVTELLCNY